ncbi:TRAP transporter small permease [Desulfomonile tiedjei]|uniref:TRAP-type C4-dicarboxylate transport system, small permease component n=1 Tax=Desulfomonile tiedjei (strain ATCC 49306 / DSM 6799 / DCB-1) TaxID=706587 RepID=I4C8L0_DESTA|nr:TRAP transporter small permease [Desulfomonile tiedjei]AFM25901.1 TRAP-type C4-dicarboxylate transport system, small permease component [Desulfomonile tiedjei DSM 6799]
MSSALKLTRSLMRVLDNVSGFLLVVITVMGFLNVVMRYLFARPIAWMEEMTVLSMVWMVYLSQGMLESENSQLRMTVVSRLFGPKLQFLVNTIRTALTLFIFGYLLISGCGVITNNYNFKTCTQALGFPIWIAFLALPVTFIIIMIPRILDPAVKYGDEPPVVNCEKGGS